MRFLNKIFCKKKLTNYFYSTIASEVSGFTKYYDKVLQFLPLENDDGILLGKIDARQKERLTGDIEHFPDLTNQQNLRTAILLNGVFNYSYDIQALLSDLKQRLSRNSRIVAVIYNPYILFLYKLANFLGIRKGEIPTTFITRVDLEGLTRISGYSIVKERVSVYCPFKMFGIGDLINRFMPCIPVLRWLSFAYIAVLRPIIPEKARPSLSCVIPARNERGNIENAIKRLSGLNCNIEIIFVEGHSTDGTWDEIQNIQQKYSDNFNIKSFQQTGRGKVDAVRLGFSKASGDLLTILDADLTVPPEMLYRFYNTYCEGHADFINGSRLVYPMEGKAMKFLNKLGNKFFAKVLSWVLDIKIGDSLCGTKLMTKHDYERMTLWRNDFGDFDPFGDFELIFPASILGLGIVDIPVRYLARTYGNTNIRRFYHGFLLLKMTLMGLMRIKRGQVSNRLFEPESKENRLFL